LRPKLEAVYDFTVAYEGGVKPTLWSGWCGSFPKRQHLHVRRFPASQLPQDKQALIQWCYDRFREKDQLLDYFEQHQHFPPRTDNSFFTHNDNNNAGKQQTSSSSSTTSPPVWEPPSWTIAFWFSVWMTATPALMYLFWIWTPFRYFQIFGWIFFAVSTGVPHFRRLRGLAPPLDYLEKLKTQKKKKQT